MKSFWNFLKKNKLYGAINLLGLTVSMAFVLLLAVYVQRQLSTDSFQENADRIYVMYAGRIVEAADTFALFDHPVHPYTRGLLASVTSLRRGGEVLETIPGVVPNLLHLPEGCSFSLRCEQCLECCASKMPVMHEAQPGHKVKCHLFDSLPRSEK